MRKSTRESSEQTRFTLPTAELSAKRFPIRVQLLPYPGYEYTSPDCRAARVVETETRSALRFPMKLHCPGPEQRQILPSSRTNVARESSADATKIVPIAEVSANKFPE